MSTPPKDKKYRWLIIAVSIAIPLVVGALNRIRIEGVDFSFLPPIYATINGLTAVTLLIALLAIKKGNMNLHKRLMQLCLLFSLSFLVMYVLYHMTSLHTFYGDVDGNGELTDAEATAAGASRTFYVILLSAHILLSMIIVPMVLFTYVRALAERFDKHRKLARITFPIWWFVAASGVVVYLMIAPYSEIRRNFVDTQGPVTIEQPATSE